MGRAFNLFVGDMSVKFGGGKVGVAQYFLEHPDVNLPVLVKQGGGCVAQLVRGVPLAFKAGGF